MRLKKYLSILLFTVISLSAPEGTSFAWSLFKIFSAPEYKQNPVNNAIKFNPDIDILYLPSMTGKTFFDSVNDLSICRNRDVRRFLNIYLTTGREYTVNAIERSKLYSDIIKDIVADNLDIPQDIMLLPLLESGFNPNAVSRSNAVGVWQFLRGTSRLLCLKTDKWIDERKDLEKSTIAAMRHLRNLRSIFSSWELTLAAYNGGAGYVKRAMIRTGKNNLWDLKKTGKLRAETSEYVARYAALMVIYKNQELFGIADEITCSPAVKSDILLLEYPVNIASISDTYGIPLDLIRKLNPGLKTNITPPYVKNYPLRIPLEIKPKLEADKEKLYALKCNAIKKHVVRKGDNLNNIAKIYRTTPRILLLLNDMRSARRIRPGQKIYVPI